jgi:hypothetical protein
VNPSLLRVLRVLRVNLFPLPLRNLCVLRVKNFLATAPACRNHHTPPKSLSTPLHPFDFI